MALAVGDLVDPDPLKAGEQVRLAPGLGGHPLADPPDAAPADPHQLGNRAARGVHRQPGDLLLEGTGEARAVAGPGDGADDDAVLGAAHSRRVGLRIGDGAEIERPPAPPALTQIEARGATPANAATVARSRWCGPTATTTCSSSSISTLSTTARSKPSRRAHTLFVRTSLPPPSISSLREARNLGAERRAPLLHLLASPRKRQESQKRGGLSAAPFTHFALKRKRFSYRVTSPSGCRAPPGSLSAPSAPPRWESWLHS